MRASERAIPVAAGVEVDAYELGRLDALHECAGILLDGAASVGYERGRDRLATFVLGKTRRGRR